jgi:hypothetical protein
MTGIGQPAYETVDFITTWAFVYMVHEDAVLLKRNAELIHANFRLSVAPGSDGDAKP